MGFVFHRISLYRRISEMPNRIVRDVWQSSIQVRCECTFKSLNPHDRLYRAHVWGYFGFYLVLPSSLTPNVTHRLIESSTSMFPSTSNGDPRKSRKIDKIKQKLVDMLRECFHYMQYTFGRPQYTGEIGFRLPKNRLPWSTLGGDLEKKGYAVANWPAGVVRDKDKGISGLSAEDVDKLLDALFCDERRLQFVPSGEGAFLCIYTIAIEESLNRVPPSVASNDVSNPLANASGEDRLSERHRPCMSMTGSQPRFRVITADRYVERPNKRQRV